MKKIVSTQGLTEGFFYALDLTKAIQERVDNKLEVFFRQCFGTDISLSSTLSYELHNGEVSAIQLTCSMDHPSDQKLLWLCDACDNFYCLRGFMVDDIVEATSVVFRAADHFDMALLIHALDYQTVSLEGIISIVDVRTTRYPRGLVIKEWNTPVDEPPVDDDDDDTSEQLDEPFVFDDKGVAYSVDGKVLRFCRCTFNETCYDVPDGVEEIADFAFLFCRNYLEITIPRSVRIIGDTLFGKGGRIEVR